MRTFSLYFTLGMIICSTVMLVGCSPPVPPGGFQGSVTRSVALSWDQISELALANLSAEERESSVVYLDERVLPTGAVVEVDRKEIRMPWPAVIAFIDLQPEANWAHDCRYLLVNSETGELQSIDARFPPFLRGAPDTLRVIWKAEAVPSWAVATD
jgi:hypothetical protein